MNELDAVAKQSATARPGKPMPRKSFSVPRQAVAPDHECDQESGSPQRTPEHHGPAVRRVDESRDRAAEAPEDRRQGDEQEADALVLRRNGVDVGRYVLSFGRLTHDAHGRQWSPPAMLARRSIRPHYSMPRRSGVVQPRNPVVAICRRLASAASTAAALQAPDPAGRASNRRMQKGCPALADLFSCAGGGPHG